MKDEIINNPFIRCYEDNVSVFENKDIIAFDLFDTVLYRTVGPSYVTRLWAKNILERYNLDMTLTQLLKKRLYAGRREKLSNILRGYDRQYDYKRMAGRLSASLGLKAGERDGFVFECLEAEERIEKHVTFASPDWMDFISYLSRTGKKYKIILISDFYLPRGIIESILAHHGIRQIFSDIFISCDYLKSKADGGLYKIAIQKSGDAAVRMVMFGDNADSDVISAGKNNIAAFHIAQPEGYYKRLTDNRSDYKSAGGLSYSLARKYRGLPFSYTAFCFYPFMRRLYNALLQNGVGDVYFLSREGELFKRLFDAFAEKQELPAKITSHYLFVSRKATLLLGINEITKEAFAPVLKNYPDITCLDFLRNLGLDGNQAVLTELAPLLERKTVIRSFLDSGELQTMIASEVFKRELRSRIDGQKRNFAMYLEQAGCTCENGVLTIVDIGFSGTTQDNLHAFFDGRVAVDGYYMFYTGKPSQSPDNTKKGLIYDANEPGLRKKSYFTQNYNVLEIVLSASHGSVLEYRDTGGKVEPVLKAIPEEERAFGEIIAPFQDNIAALFDELCRELSAAAFVERDYLRYFLRLYSGFIFNPSDDEMRLYSNIPIIDNFAGYKEFKQSGGHYIKPRGFSVKSLLSVFASRGGILREQNTNWLAVSLYKLELWRLNQVLFLLAPLSQALFEHLEARKVKRRLGGASGGF